MPAGQRYLLLDEVEVVEQPGLCRQDALARRRRSDHRVVGQDTVVLGQAVEQSVLARTRIHTVARRGRDGGFQLLGVEEFRAQQLRSRLA